MKHTQAKFLMLGISLSAANFCQAERVIHTTNIVSKVTGNWVGPSYAPDILAVGNSVFFFQNLSSIPQRVKIEILKFEINQNMNKTTPWVAGTTLPSSSPAWDILAHNSLVAYRNYSLNSLTLNEVTIAANGTTSVAFNWRCDFGSLGCVTWTTGVQPGPYGCLTAPDNVGTATVTMKHLTKITVAEDKGAIIGSQDAGIYFGCPGTPNFMFEVEPNRDINSGRPF